MHCGPVRGRIGRCESASNSTPEESAPTRRQLMQAALVAASHKARADLAARFRLKPDEIEAQEAYWQRRTEQGMRAKEAQREKRKVRRPRDDNPAPAPTKLWAKVMSLQAAVDADFGYFTYRGPRAVGQRLHSSSCKAEAYELPTGFFRQQWQRHGFLRSWKRGLGLRLDRYDSKKLKKWINRNPTFYSGGTKPIDRFKFEHYRRPNYFSQPTKPASDQVNEDHGPRQITIEISAETARLLAELATRCTEADQANNSFTSHGPLTIDSLVAMLVNDAAMVVSRPGSWEGANMAGVFASHGYDV